MTHQFWRFIQWVAVAVVLPTTTLTSHAAPTAREAVQPAAQLQHYEALCQRLRIDREQRYVADIVFQNYDDAMNSVVRQAQDKADQVGAAWLRDAIAGRLRASSEQLNQWEAAAMSAYADAWPQADALFEGFLLDLRSAVAETSDAEFDAAARALRRAVLLHPRQPQGGAGSVAAAGSGYVGDGADLLQIVERLSGPRGPMPPILPSPAPTDTTLFASPEVIAALTSYEQQLDALLRETYAAAREQQLLTARAKVQRDSVAASAVEKAAVERWHRLHQLNSSFAGQIGALLAAAPAAAAPGNAGETAARFWRQQVDLALYPWLFADDKTDHVMAWIRSDSSVTAEQRAAAEESHATYLAQRDALRRAALEQLVRTRVQSGMMLQPLRTAVRGIDAERLRAQQEVDAAFHELIALEAGARKNLEALLNDAQRGQLSKRLTGHAR